MPNNDKKNMRNLCSLGGGGQKTLYLAYSDRQTNILLTEIKVITDLFVIVIREIYVHVYIQEC